LAQNGADGFGHLREPLERPGKSVGDCADFENASNALGAVETGESSFETLVSKPAVYSEKNVKINAFEAFQLAVFEEGSVPAA
jgi:hypothetical protein